MSYIRRHWQGKYSLALSFWLNFFVLGLVLNYMERFIYPPYIQNETAVTAAAIVFFVVIRLIIYPWQIVGVVKACDRYTTIHNDRSWVIAAQSVVVVSILATLVASFASYQSLLEFKRSLHPPENDLLHPEYTLTLARQNTLIHLQGPIQVGTTRALSEMLLQYPDVTGIILDSDGGRIYEGRGLAKVIRENNLNTYTLNECLSACTTAFIAGKTRSMGKNAKLGFHQYQSFTVFPNIDIEKEQEKDIALFKRQGISLEFLQKVFAKPPDEMWWPNIEELKKSRVIHHWDFSFPNDQTE